MWRRIRTFHVPFNRRFPYQTAPHIGFIHFLLEVRWPRQLHDLERLADRRHVLWEFEGFVDVLLQNPPQGIQELLLVQAFAARGTGIRCPSYRRCYREKSALWFLCCRCLFRHLPRFGTHVLCRVLVRRRVHCHFLVLRVHFPVAPPTSMKACRARVQTQNEIRCINIISGTLEY